MKKIIEYGLVCRNEIVYFTKDVNELIKAGYQPYEAPFGMVSNEVVWHYQAMVKYEDS